MAYQPIFSAVPAALLQAASTLQDTLPAAKLAPAMQAFTVSVHGERLCAPYRVYLEPKRFASAIARSRGDVRLLALCLGTRHCDGYFREDCLRQIVAIDRPWADPFIVQLLGEYVVEIAEVIAAAIAESSQPRFSGFVKENPAFMATTRRRAISYWACYYRSRFPVLQTYPAFTALEAIEQVARGT